MTVTVVAPYLRMHPTTARLLNRHAPGHVRVHTPADDTEAYWRLLAHWWTQPGDLVLIEQDIGLRADVLPGFADCLEPVCGHPYLVTPAQLMRICTGCIRFRAELKEAEPDLLEAVGRIDDDGLPARDWRRLDVRVIRVLRARGYEVHEHLPAVPHYHRYF